MSHYVRIICKANIEDYSAQKELGFNLTTTSMLIYLPQIRDGLHHDYTI